MRTVTFGAACSLDNFIARLDHSTDWLMWSDEVQAVTSQYWATVDTVVMGRKTYEVAVKAGTTAYPGVKNYVFSSTYPAPADAGVTIIRDDAVAFMRELKRQPGKGICVMGGGELAHSLFEAGLIDEVGLNVHPIILGDGIPFFLRSARSTGLELVDCKRFRNGCVLLLYRVHRTG